MLLDFWNAILFFCVWARCLILFGVIWEETFNEEDMNSAGRLILKKNRVWETRLVSNDRDMVLIHCIIEKWLSCLILVPRLHAFVLSLPRKLNMININSMSVEFIVFRLASLFDLSSCLCSKSNVHQTFCLCFCFFLRFQKSAFKTYVTLFVSCSFEKVPLVCCLSSFFHSTSNWWTNSVVFCFIFLFALIWTGDLIESYSYPFFMWSWCDSFT